MGTWWLGRLEIRKSVRMSQVFLCGNLLTIPRLLDDGVDAFEGFT